jgi:hypothetical protein
MAFRIEEFIAMIYRNYRKRQIRNNLSCPREESLVSFLEGKTPQEEFNYIQEHLLVCDRCAEIFALFVLEPKIIHSVPSEIIEKVKSLVPQNIQAHILELTLKIREKFLEILSTTGDIILGNEIIPLPVLRSRQIKDFGDELILVKEIGNIRINLNIEKREKELVKIIFTLTDKKTSLPLSDLRVVLLKDDTELESYVVESGQASFDKLGLGRFIFQILRGEEILGMIKLELV